MVETVPDWTALFAEAGLEESRWSRTDPEWNPLSHADTRAAWWMRVGLVAAILGSIVTTLLLLWPITADTSAWYFEVGLVTVLIVLATSVYGFRIAVAGRPLVGAAVLGD